MQMPLSLLREDKSGWLWKRGKINTAFRRRYFLLQGSELFYFRNQTDSQPRGVIKLANFRLDRAEDEAPYSFRINTRDRVWTIRAEKEEELEAWMEAIDPIDETDLGDASEVELPKLSVDQLKAILSEMIAVFNMPRNREQIDAAAQHARTVGESEIAACSSVCIRLQARVVGNNGFPASRRGVVMFTKLCSTVSDPEVLVLRRQVQAFQGIKKVSLTVDQARASLRDVINAFAQPDNAASIAIAFQDAGDDKGLQKRVALTTCANIERGVVANYGFEPNGLGVLQWAAALRELNDPEVQRLWEERRRCFQPPRSVFYATSS